MTNKTVAIVGSGIAGMAAATCLADQGFNVTVYEKNNTAGGRCREFSQNGFTFDMGPSWYWMPDVFERYFKRFGKSTSDYYKLKRLDPSYRVIFSENEIWDIPASLDRVYDLFESVEPGSSDALKEFLAEGAYKYQVGMNNLVYKPGKSWGEFLDKDLISGVFKLHVFKSIASYIRKYFKDPRIIQLLEFPVLFLGAMPSETPALYSLMNYADISLGTWYPEGGMYSIIRAMEDLARSKGVKFSFNSEINRFNISSGVIESIEFQNGTDSMQTINTDLVVAGADYHFVEQELLPSEYRQYSQEYWASRKMAPSSLIFYLGISQKVKNLQHHNLFFDADFNLHAEEIYKSEKWPSQPLFYVCCPSKTDASSAPEGKENLFILIPVAPGLKDDDQNRIEQFRFVMDRLEKHCDLAIRNHIEFQHSYAHNDFIEDYHAFKGNAYGLANTLMQTANLKPSITNKKVRNLFYTGQLTVPGPGVPPALISGQVVADYIFNNTRK